ncbi:unnamed protein product [Cochlearia groenlandica]
MRWGRKKPVSSSSSGLSRALPVSWLSKLNGSSDMKPAKDKKQDDEKMSAKSSMSSTKRRNGINERSNTFHRVSVEKEDAATESNEKFEEIMSSVRKKVRDFQRETRGFLVVEAMDGRDKGTVIMTPRTQVNRDKHRCERRDQRLLEQKPKRSEQGIVVKTKKPARKISTEDSAVSGHTVTKQANQWQNLKETKLREVKLKADQQRKSLYIKRDLHRLGPTTEHNKVRVFSPRASEKCRVKAIEDLKKSKLRSREHEQEHESESFAVVKRSSDPEKDFRDSMIEMIMENGINNHPEELKDLQVCYLRLNADEYHDMIIKVFQQVQNDLIQCFGA